MYGDGLTNSPNFSITEAPTSQIEMLILYLDFFVVLLVIFSQELHTQRNYHMNMCVRKNVKHAMHKETFLHFC